MQRSCVPWWLLRPFLKTQASSNVSSSTPSAPSPALPCWRFTMVRYVCVYSPSLSTCAWVTFTPLLSCRPGGAAEGGGHPPAGSGLSQGQWGRCPSRNALVPEEQRGLSCWPDRLWEPSSSGVAHRPFRGQHPCSRVSVRLFTHFVFSKVYKIYMENLFKTRNTCPVLTLIQIIGCFSFLSGQNKSRFLVWVLIFYIW